MGSDGCNLLVALHYLSCLMSTVSRHEYRKLICVLHFNCNVMHDITMEGEEDILSRELFQGSCTDMQNTQILLSNK